MCGRYTETKSLARLRKRFPNCAVCAFSEDLFTPRYNIAPMQEAPVILMEPASPREAARDARAVMKLLRWGLVPSWAADEKAGSKMINAKAETVAEKPAYRNAFKQRRCLVVADGFFEWKKSGTARLPFWFTLRDEEPFAFAGLWEKWRRPDGSDLETFAILTTEPNELVRPCHDRMPLILRPEHHEAWLDSALDDATRLMPLLQPVSASEMTSRPVSTLVNNPKHDDPRCVEPLPNDELF